MTDSDDGSLQRFLDAQAGVIEQAYGELARGRKTTHWMWFVFPQLAGLGVSRTARFYAIRDLDEAAAYWHHPVLGNRLRDGVAVVCRHEGVAAEAIFGGIDAVKFRSCLTLFLAVAAGAGRDALQCALDRFYAGRPDPRTEALLRDPSRKR
jgi:uncharacterized protein (DUF1810 family)